MSQLKRIAAVVLVLGVVAAGAGMRARQAAEEDSPQPAQEAQAAAPRTVPRRAPAQPGRVAEPPDPILVEVLEALPGRPISGERLVRPDGKISLGFYGEVFVAGMTTREIKEKAIAHLQKYLTDVQLGLIEYNSRQPGQVSKTVAAADSTRVYVDVTTYNSKGYYVLGAVAAPRPLSGHGQRYGPRCHQPLCRRAAPGCFDVTSPGPSAGPGVQQPPGPPGRLPGDRPRWRCRDQLHAPDR